MHFFACESLRLGATLPSKESASDLANLSPTRLRSPHGRRMETCSQVELTLTRQPIRNVVCYTPRANVICRETPRVAQVFLTNHKPIQSQVTQDTILKFLSVLKHIYQNLPAIVKVKQTSGFRCNNKSGFKSTTCYGIIRMEHESKTPVGGDYSTRLSFAAKFTDRCV